jgi:penicillin-binding protein-related factor A (putative recombinase)
MATRKQSVKIGRLGEIRAEFWFSMHGWHMIRTQPETRMAYFSGKATVIHAGGGGVADYTGFHEATREYRACEVKTVHGKTCPRSKLTPSQHEFMASIPACCAFVGVYYIDHDKFFVYPYTGAGYVLGVGNI